jgi:hypothetical protein
VGQEKYMHLPVLTTREKVQSFGNRWLVQVWRFRSTGEVRCWRVLVPSRKGEAERGAKAALGEQRWPRSRWRRVVASGNGSDLAEAPGCRNPKENVARERAAARPLRGAVVGGAGLRAGSVR